MALIIGLAAQSSNLYIYLGLIRHYGLISRTWQTVSVNFLSIKPYLVAQILANIKVIILFPTLHCIVKRFLQKKSFSIKDKDIIKLFFLSLERAIFFSGQCSQYYLYLKHL